MIFIKPFLTEFQIHHPHGVGFCVCTAVPSNDGKYQVLIDSIANHPRDSKYPLIQHQDTVNVDGVECQVDCSSMDCMIAYLIPNVNETLIHHNTNSVFLESYRNGVYNKNVVHQKFMESTKLTESFKQFLKSRSVDITIISSNTLILIGVLFYEFAGSRSNELAHQVCIDPFHQKYDIAVIVK